MIFTKNRILISLALMIMLLATVIFIFIYSNEYDTNHVINGNSVVDTSVNIISVPRSNCSTTLNPGWNLVSFYCLGLFTSRSTALNSLNNSYTAIFTYDETDVLDPWKSYNPSLPSWTVQQLNNMDRLSGYWIYVNNSINFTYDGIYTDSINHLHSGWNLIGYPRYVSVNVSSITADVPFTVLESYNASNSSWLIYIKGNSNNDFYEFDPYKGYWLNVTSDYSWNITT